MSLRKFVSLIVTVVLFLTVGLAAAQSNASVEATVVPDELNVRSEPSTSSTVLTKITGGTPVTVTALSSNFTSGARWAKIADLDGWVLSSYLQFPADFDRSALPIITPDGEEDSATVDESDEAEVEFEQGAPVSANAAGITLRGRARNDGRLNPQDDLGGVVIYCVNRAGSTTRGNFRGGGIAVFNYEISSIVFFARDRQITRAQEAFDASEDSEATYTTIFSENGFTLYYLRSGAYQINGTGNNGQPIAFQWRDCEPNG